MDIAFSILGSTALSVRGEPVADWGEPRLRGILGVLLACAGQRIPVETLVERVWEEDRQPPANDRTTLNTYAGRIRKALHEANAPAQLLTVRGAYLLQVERTRIDYYAFESLAGRARDLADEGKPDRALEMITKALSLWRDAPLADLRTEWAVNWRQWATERRWLPGQRLLLDQLIRLGRLDPALARLDELEDGHGLDLELAKRRLRILAARSGEEETTAYFDLRRRLKDAGSLEDAEELRRYHDQLRERGGWAAPVTVASAPSPAEWKPPRVNLPADVSDFVGHEELQRKLGKFATTETGALRRGVAIVDGLAGIGKTALVVHWAHRLLGRQVDHAVYLDLLGFAPGRSLTVDDVIGELLIAFGASLDLLTTRAQRETALRDTLIGTRTLIILDNAANSDHLRPLLLPLSPALVVATSRHRLTGLAGRHGVLHFSVSPLDRRQSAELLAVRIGERADSDPHSVARLAQLCGGLPMALQLVAHHIDLHQGTPLARFAEELKDRNRLLDIGDDGDDPPASLRAALSTSLEALPEEARQLFEMLGLVPLPEIGSPAAAALMGTPPARAQHALDILASAHLIQPVATPGRYRLHDLLRAFARQLSSRMEEDVKAQAESRLLSYFLHASYAADRALFPFRAPVPMLARCDDVHMPDFADSDSAIAWLLREREVFMTLIPWAAQRKHWDYAWRLPHNLYGAYRRYGHYENLSFLYQTAIEAAEAIGDRDGEGASRNDLGLILAALEERGKSVRQFQLAASLARETGELSKVATTLLHLGKAEAQSGNHDQAMTHYREALRLAESTNAIALEASILDALGRSHHATDHHGAALEAFGRSLRIRRALGNWHGQTQTLAEVADCFRAKGDLTEAAIHCRRALDIVERIHDVEVAPRACEVMAHIQVGLGRNRTAMEYARQAIRLAERIRAHPVTAGALHALGLALHATGHDAAAEEGWRQAAKLYSALEDHRRLREVQADLSMLRDGALVPVPGDQPAVSPGVLHDPH
ncbi:tetratricopeptide repeat protein [Amycolatopsis cynarae]|uniref:Tetratricopeptide repeat protein n=1 Tax=Amycolatopsis cynarae TaxID=2995223 RepID=A0ABY7B8F2_9PSEU|nr:tetratricopeptide repeat protein [Amycolatopsis sp. HUAS 11-8]WAL68225.1 tetratricopeptide repeat protein [Amycolatopsis sp. HUAS 11-8]